MARGNIRKRPAASDDDEEPEAEEMTLQGRINDARNLIKNRVRTKVRAGASAKMLRMPPAHHLQGAFGLPTRAASGATPSRALGLPEL